MSTPPRIEVALDGHDAAESDPDAAAASSISRPASRRPLRSLSMLIDPLDVARANRPSRERSVSGVTLLASPCSTMTPDDILKPVTMFDFDRPLSIRERQERVRARLAALQAQSSQQTCTRARRGCGLLEMLRRTFCCAGSDQDD